MTDTQILVADPWGTDRTKEVAAESVSAVSRSVAQEIWRHFSRRPSVVFGVVMIALLMLFAFVGPSFTGHSLAEQVLTKTNLPPVLNTSRVRLSDGSEQNFFITTDLKLLPVSDDGHVLEPLSVAQEDLAVKEITFDYETASGAREQVVLSYDWVPASIVASDGTPYKRDHNIMNRDNVLGTDGLGRDLLTRLMYGTQISLLVAFLAALINLTIGVIYGAISGFVGGRTDSIMMRIVDIINTIPLILYVILIMVWLSSGFLSIVIALSSVYWVQMARIVRGQMHSLKQQEFVIAAKTIGSSVPTIMWKHLLPNALGPILVTATMLIPTAIFIEAFLSFIGLGVAAPLASLGTMCNDAVQTLRTAPYQLALPSLVICFVMFAFTFVGDGLRDALDPKIRRRR